MIKAENISVTFRRGLFKSPIKALSGFDLKVEKGDIFGLLGPNGAGKSTAMYCMLGLIQPEAGSVSVFGQRPRPGSKLFKKVAYLPEEPHYHLYLTVEEAVSYYASLYGLGISKTVVRDAIERVGLTEFRDLRLSKCSKGMKQKMGIAQCLVIKPEIVFLDEPTRGLDPMIVKVLREILLEMNRNGATIIINSHVLSEIELVCNRVAIMDRGKVVVNEALHNLKRFDLETYEVEFDSVAETPEFITVIHKSPDTIKGEVPVTKLSEFIAFTKASGLRMYECSLKKTTLEDVFFRILKDKPSGKNSARGASKTTGEKDV